MLTDIVPLSNLFNFKLFLVRGPKDGELLGLEWGMILQVRNMTFPDENPCVRCQYSRTPLTRTLKGNENLFELAGFRVIGVD